ncbi:GntR family transcriptional regulator [Microbacterium sp. JB110]|uniref:GntR family transcriptional regulator n=1 Tax=unclassified Microbacterium TaxID=2609290 RepID=UPI00097F4F17|nr:GntR family transcriptional regulator [Microbacterium sp. JB110]SJM64324.1 Transcriptional regulator, GntR family [Frigoribacterium sp. JB110]
MAGGDISRRALRDEVYDRILQMLLAGELLPGERVSIDTMARELKVSPTPVREAMVHLERTGLVTREALKGYRVAPPLDAVQLGELFDARLPLEVAAARLAAQHGGDRLAADLTAAQAKHTRMTESVLSAHRDGRGVPLNLTQRYFDADHAVHLVLFERANNRYLTGMYEDLGALTHRMRQAALRGPEDVREAVSEHEAIVTAFADGAEAGIAALVAHIENVRGRSLSGG